jgi:hypothetical protein
VIGVDKSKLDSTNFAGNAIDFGADIAVYEFTSWVCPHPANPPSFEYPGDRLHNFYGTIPDEEMWKYNQKIRDHGNDPVIIVIKRSLASGLTIRPSDRKLQIAKPTRFFLLSGCSTTSYPSPFPRPHTRYFYGLAFLRLSSAFPGFSIPNFS